MNDAFKTSQWLGIIVVALSALTAAGWLFGIEALTSSSIPDTIAMKFITAVLLVLAGIVLATMGAAHRHQIDVTPLVVFGCGFIILLLTVTLVYHTVAGGYDGVSLLVPDETGAAQTLFPGRPPVVTLVALLLMCVIAGIGTVWSEKAHPTIKTIGILITIAGALPVIGYALGIRALYYGGIAWTNPMPFKEALLLILVGAGLWLIGRTPHRR